MILYELCLLKNTRTCCQKAGNKAMRYDKAEMQRIFYGDEYIDVEDRVAAFMRSGLACVGFVVAALLVVVTLWLWVNK